MVGAVLVKVGKIIGRGWHRRAGGPQHGGETLGGVGRMAQTQTAGEATLDWLKRSSPKLIPPEDRLGMMI
jgi:hypothetical protein